MSESNENAENESGGTTNVINKWLQNRKHLLVRYCDLVAKGEFDDCEQAVKDFRKFCQVLVDYVSAGHFEFYDQLFEEAATTADAESIEAARKLVLSIQKHTDAALEFNDTFDKTPEELAEMNAMLKALSTLGERLEERFELEDVLIKKLHKNPIDELA